MFIKGRFQIFILSFIVSCIEPYEINTGNYNNLLVVDGLITNENKTHMVKLSRSVKNLNQKAEKVSGARVFITDDLGNYFYLAESGEGVYVTDSTDLMPQTGRTYQLTIETPEGKSYVSSPTTMLPQTEIDNLYFRKDKEWDLNNQNENTGISIFLDGLSYKGAYIRWTYEETWKFKIPYPSPYTFNDDRQLIQITPINYICWKKNFSNNISVQAFGQFANEKIKDKKLLFIPTKLNDKLTMRYSVLVKQMSISKDEYYYWEKLKTANEEVGNVFGTQPFGVTGNISCLTDKEEPVLGYFQVASVATHRLYINSSELDILDLPNYNSSGQCEIQSILVDRKNYWSVYEIYEKLVLNNSHRIIEPIYDLWGIQITGLILTDAICTDCSLTGDPQKPYFWED